MRRNVGTWERGNVRARNVASLLWGAVLVLVVALLLWAQPAVAGPVDLVFDGPTSAAPGEFVSWNLTLDGYAPTPINGLELALVWDGDAVALADMDPVDYAWEPEHIWYDTPGDLAWEAWASIPFPETDLVAQEFRFYVWDAAPPGAVIDFTVTAATIWDETGTDVFSGLVSIPTLTIVPEPAGAILLLIGAAAGRWRR